MRPARIAKLNAKIVYRIGVLDNLLPIRLILCAVRSNMNVVQSPPILPGRQKKESRII